MSAEVIVWNCCADPAWPARSFQATYTSPRVPVRSFQNATVEEPPHMERSGRLSVRSGASPLCSGASAAGDEACSGAPASLISAEALAAWGVPSMGMLVAGMALVNAGAGEATIDRRPASASNMQRRMAASDKRLMVPPCETTGTVWSAGTGPAGGRVDTRPHPQGEASHRGNGPCGQLWRVAPETPAEDAAHRGQVMNRPEADPQLAAGAALVDRTPPHPIFGAPSREHAHISCVTIHVALRTS